MSFLNKMSSLTYLVIVSIPLMVFADNPYGVAFVDKIQNESELKLIQHVKRCIDLADVHLSKLSETILQLPGMSSSKNRHFLNNLCSLPNASYLEIGVWKGSTWVSALYQNHGLRQAIAMDNWSEFDGPMDDFMANCQQYLYSNQYAFYSADCFKIDVAKVFKEKVNLYFYDGGHTALDQELALTYFDEIFEDLFVLVVDDWNHEPARIGTEAGIEKLKYDILFRAELPGGYINDTPQWWNGLFVAVVRKPV